MLSPVAPILYYSNPPSYAEQYTDSLIILEAFFMATEIATRGVRDERLRVTTYPFLTRPLLCVLGRECAAVGTRSAPARLATPHGVCGNAQHDRYQMIFEAHFWQPEVF